jgi:hypothetical protein
MGHDKYYGYTTAKNTDLIHARQFARKTGDGDISRYPPVSNSPDYTPTFNPADPKGLSEDKINADTIERVKKRIDSQSAEDMDSMAAEWKNIYDALRGVSDYVTTQTDPLTDSWRSPAADAFMLRGPGATLKSLDDWMESAQTNQNAMTALAVEIRKYQSKIADAWTRYTRETGAYATGSQYQNDLARKRGPGMGGKGFYIAPKPLTDAQKHEVLVAGLKEIEDRYGAEARGIEHDMAHAYWQVAVPGMNGSSGTVYEGPTDAVIAPPTDFMNINVPGGPGAAPAPPPPPPAAPPPPPPPPPQLPGAPLDLAGAPALAPPPAPPAVPGGPGGLPGQGLPLPPVMPNLPNNLPGGPPGGLPGGAPPGLGNLPGGPGPLPGGFGPFPGAGNLPVSPGVIGGPNSAPPPPPPGAGAKPNLKKGGGPGVLHNKSLGGQGNPLLPPGAGGKQKEHKAGQLGGGPHAEVPNAFGGTPPGMAPPVLNRKAQRDRADTSPHSSGTTGLGSPPPGATAPVLGSRKAAGKGRRGAGTGLPGQPGSGMVPPGSRRTGSPGGAGVTGGPVMDGAEWRDAGDGMPPPSAPVLGSRAREVGQTSAVPPWTEEFGDGTPAVGATRPVVGRSAARRAADAERRRSRGRGRARAADGALNARRAAKEQAVRERIAQELERQDAATTAPVSDEQAFSVQTPGGTVLANQPERAPEAAPRPTLGAN